MHLENILYYNMKLFDELRLTAPTGYDDLIAACEAIKAAKPDMSCLACRLEGQLVRRLRPRHDHDGAWRTGVLRQVLQG